MSIEIDELIARARLAARVVRSSGVLHGLTAPGLVRFARDARRQRLGPHLASMLHAHTAPAREAVVGGARRLSYGDLERETNQLGHALVARGVGPGDRVAIMMPNVPEYVVALQALPRIGAVAAQIGVRLKRGEIGAILANARPRAVLYHASLEGELEPALEAAGGAIARIAVGDGGLGEPWAATLARHDGAGPPARRPGDAGGVIVYTSGTTGTPKGARRHWSQTGIDAAADLVGQVGLGRHERHLVACPLYHSAGMAFTMLTLALGGACVLLEHFDAEEALAVIDRERVTSTVLVPTMLERLIAVAPEVRARHELASLRAVLSGAAPAATATAARFQAAYGRILWNFYGATETGLVTLAAPDDHAAHPGTVGRALFGNRIRIVGDDGREVPAGEVGEVYVESSMLVEYHGDRAATEGAMRDGAFSVGDLGRLDADGHLHVVARKHDMVISGGVNVYPAEIEQHLVTHPDVVEAAVLGVPDEAWGESLVAFVVPRAGAILVADDVVAHCRAALADYKRPRRVEIVDTLPRTPTGKVLKRELRDRLT